MASIKGCSATDLGLYARDSLAQLLQQLAPAPLRLFQALPGFFQFPTAEGPRIRFIRRPQSPGLRGG